MTLDSPTGKSICDCLNKNVHSLHNYKYLEIPIWNIQLNISWEVKEVLTPYSTNPQLYNLFQLTNSAKGS